MDFNEDRLEEIFKKSIQHNMTHLYQLKLTEDKAIEDCKVAAKNISVWLENMFDKSRNSYGITYDRTIATEQEFNSAMYGLKGKLDATIVLKNADDPS
jgi:hypothetical protein